MNVSQPNNNADQRIFNRQLNTAAKASQKNIDKSIDINTVNITKIGLALRTEH